MTMIYRELVSESRRTDHTAALFGVDFPMRLEPFVFAVTGHLAPAYRGGYWHFYALSNGGFYMAPDDAGTLFDVRCENGFEGQLSADALGVVACLYAYSHLSFGDGAFAQRCAEHYHLLRDHMLEHLEVEAILAAID